ncbi:helix-turn-helix transcriptional regulator [Nocardia sp. SSK8]|uniref:helix-turn-helix transcriptional regulator n=1 Tax=Nocardia sp. SSK8 TaxID=3120154 RepID=UPI00300B9A99
MHSGPNRLSTDEVGPAEVVDYWQSVIDETAAPTTLTPIPGIPFYGEIIPLIDTDSLSLAWSRCGGHISTRTPRHIARATEEFVITIVDMPDTTTFDPADLRPGALALFDTSRPTRLRLEQHRSMLVTRMRRETIAALATVGEPLFGAPSMIAPDPSAQVLANFVASLARLAVSAPEQAASLATHAPQLTAALIDLSVGAQVSEQTSETHLKARVERFLAAGYRDPDLTADEVAKACFISRRTLFRVVGEDGVARTLRQLRIAHVRRALLRYPDKSITAIAAEAGFRSERTLYRAFQSALSMTPTEFRRAAAVCVG